MRLKEFVCRYNTGLCRGTDLRKGTKTFRQHWRSFRTQWCPSFLNGRSLEPPIRGLDRGGDQEPDGVTRWSQSSRVPLWRRENLPEGQPSLQHSTYQAFMVERPDGRFTYLALLISYVYAVLYTIIQYLSHLIMFTYLALLILIYVQWGVQHWSLSISIKHSRINSIQAAEM